MYSRGQSFTPFGKPLPNDWTQNATDKIIKPSLPDLAVGAVCHDRGLHRADWAVKRVPLDHHVRRQRARVDRSTHLSPVVIDPGRERNATDVVATDDLPTRERPGVGRRVTLHVCEQKDLQA